MTDAEFKVWVKEQVELRRRHWRHIYLLLAMLSFLSLIATLEFKK